MSKKYVGPYTITNILSPVTIKVQMGNKETVVHTSRVKRYVSRPNYLLNANSPLDRTPPLSPSKHTLTTGERPDKLQPSNNLRPPPRRQNLRDTVARRTKNFYID